MSGFGDLPAAGWLDALAFGWKGPPRDISKTAFTIWSKFWPGRGGVGGGAPTKFGVDQRWFDG